MTETSAAPAALNLDALEATARAAEALAPGQWAWRGNTDHEEPYLACIVPSLGRVEVLGHVSVDRDVESFDAQLHLSRYRNTFHLADKDVPEFLRDWAWANEEYEVPNTDSRLSVTDEQNVKQPVRDLVTYEVARHRGLPDDTQRTHEGIYRGDIVDVRNPVARHLAAASPETVLALITRVRELEARSREAIRIHADLTVHYDQWGYENDSAQGHGGHCGLCREFDGSACPTVLALAGTEEMGVKQ